MKNNQNLTSISWSEMANFDPSFLRKRVENVFMDKNPLNPPSKAATTQFERPENARAYTNAELGYEYLKIAEGCNNSCSFCIIPKIRGKQTSLPIEKLVKESKNLIAQGVKELILITQDSTRYGVDLYGKSQLFELLEAIDKLE